MHGVDRGEECSLGKASREGSKLGGRAGGKDVSLGKSGLCLMQWGRVLGVLEHTPTTELSPLFGAPVLVSHWLQTAPRAQVIDVTFWATENNSLEKRAAYEWN